MTHPGAKYFVIVSSLMCSITLAVAQQPVDSATSYLIKADKIFDGSRMQSNWTILVEGQKIKAAGPQSELRAGFGLPVLDLGKLTVLPGLIEGHAHLLLHPYNETSWNDQVLVESVAERVARAVVHAETTLLAGVTTVRDLGSEGAGYADVGLKAAIEKGIIPGPRMIVAGPAIVATGSYGPRGFADQVTVPLGAEVADGHDGLIRTVRDQIGKGADIIKVYADYRWGPNGEAMPTFTQNELNTIVEVAGSSGRAVVAHAATPEGMRRAIQAGVASIEHGDGGTEEVFRLMKEKGVALCPTLAAGDAILQYRGWKKGTGPAPERIVRKKESFAQALRTGVSIIAGGDVGVFPHGDNVRELEMMVEYGMPAFEVLKAATSGNAALLRLDAQIGYIRSGHLADIIAVEGDPTTDISALRKIKWVIKNGKIVRRAID